MNYVLKDYEVPSTVIFFDSRVEREIGFIYGLNIQNDKGTLIKVPAGTYTDHFDKFFNFKDGDNVINPFNQNYPQNRSYIKQCDLYYIGKNIGTTQELKYNVNISGWTTDNEHCSYYFTSGCITNIPAGGNIASNKMIIKNLINNDVQFPISTFILDNNVDYSLSNTYSIPNITYDSGTIFYDAKVSNKIGYIYGLQIKNNQADIIISPAVRYFEDKTTSILFTYNNRSDLFTNLYPEEQSYKTKCKIYYITKEGLYFNISTRQWSTDKSKATYFFTEENAQTNISSLSLEGTTIGYFNISIKYLVADANLQFPIRAGKGFEVIDINDYLG